MTEPRWISAADLVRINIKEVAATGEPHLVINHEALAAIEARPQLAFEYGTSDVALLAAKLVLAVSVRHAFIQGNKRTAHTAAITFLRVNGYRETIPNDGRSAQWLIDALAGKLTEENLAQLYADYLVPSDRLR